MVLVCSTVWFLVVARCNAPVLTVILNGNMVITGRRGKLVAVVAMETVPAAVRIKAFKYCYRYGCANKLRVMVTICTPCFEMKAR